MTLEDPLELFTFRPRGHDPRGLLVVFHGVDRNAEDYRDFARPLAEDLNLIVVAPLFDRFRFPSWRYQHGGIVFQNEIQRSELLTANLVLKLVERLRREEGRLQMPYFLVGHSAGGQFLSRLAAYSPNDAERVVIANPSTYVLPSLEATPPYGFGRVNQSVLKLKNYLAAPITIFLGQMDSGTKNLADVAEAARQGGNRLERGRRAYCLGKASAAANNWPFNWRLIEVPDVGHNARLMFGSRLAQAALSKV